jgi:hypothetical protein
VAKLPSVTSSIPRDLQQFILRVKETLEGTGPDAMVSARQLIAAGIAEGIGNGGITAPVSDVVDPPRAPTGVSAAGALATIIVSWNSPAYRGHAYSEIWAASRTQAQTDATPPENPIIGQAELVGMTAGNNFSHNLGSGAQRWYWVRFVNRSGVAGPYNLTNGTFGQTSQDPEYMLEVLTDAVTSSQLASTLLGNINTTFSQTSEPTAKADGTALVAGDIWIDITQGQNRMYRYNGDDWIDVQDSGIAQAIGSASGAQGTADGKVTTYYQTGAPSNSAGTLTEGDLWVDTDDGNNLYRWDSDGGTGGNGVWVDIQDGGISQAIQDAAGAQSTADGKITSYYQDNAPTNSNGELSEGDLWTDTNDNDATYRWDATGGENSDGAWVRVGLASFADVTSSITDQVGYCELSIVLFSGDTAKSVSTANTTQTACQAAQADANKPPNYTYAWKSDGAIASELKTVTSSVDGNTATIQQNIGSIDGLEAQYTVKIDNNGHVSGFGLASTTVDGARVSDFMVAADRFSVVNPTVAGGAITACFDASNSSQRYIIIPEAMWDSYTHASGDKLTIKGMGSLNNTYEIVSKGNYAQPSIGKALLVWGRSQEYPYTYLPDLPSANGQSYDERMAATYPAATGTINLSKEAPFIISTGSTQINGVTVPAGTYIDSAMIADATIKNAQIGSLTADKITASLLNTVDFYGNTIAGASIYLGGTVTYSQTNNVNTGIQSIASPKVAMTSTGAVFAVDAFTINNPGGTDVVPFSITSDVVSIDSALIKDGTITNAKIENQIASTAYLADNNTGWAISKDGDAILNDATFRGTLDVGGSSGSRMTITSTKLRVYDGTTLRVKIGDLS